MKNKKYRPIQCELYDELEIWAMRKQSLEIVYNDKGEEQMLQGAKIKNIYTREKVEYLLLESGEEIRLDHLIRIEDKLFQKSC